MSPGSTSIVSVISLFPFLSWIITSGKFTTATLDGFSPSLIILFDFDFFEIIIWFNYFFLIVSLPVSLILSPSASVSLTHFSTQLFSFFFFFSYFLFWPSDPPLIPPSLSHFIIFPFPFFPCSLWLCLIVTRTHSLHYTRTAFFPTAVSLPVFGPFDEFISFVLFSFSLFFLSVSLISFSQSINRP